MSPEERIAELEALLGEARDALFFVYVNPMGPLAGLKSRIDRALNP